MLRPDGKATFFIDPNAAAAVLNVLRVFIINGQATVGKLPPGAYNVTATYIGDGVYPPATASAKLLVSPTCILTTIVLS